MHVESAGVAGRPRRLRQVEVKRETREARREDSSTSAAYGEEERREGGKARAQASWRTRESEGEMSAAPDEGRRLRVAGDEDGGGLGEGGCGHAKWLAEWRMWD